MMKHLLCILLSLVWLPAVQAAPVPSLPAHLRLTHIAADKWRADYVFAAPISKFELGPKPGEYRAKAWRILTPGLRLVELPDQEMIVGGGRAPFSKLSIEVRLFLPYGEKSYTPFERMSDGGTAVFMGFFMGDAVQGKRRRPLHLRLELAGLPHETVITPDDRNSDQLSYAYFGPATPAPAGAANTIIDPKTPTWMAQLLRETTTAITKYYDHAFHRPLPYKPLIMLSVSDFDTDGLSMKGGAVGKQVVYRVGGTALLRASPQVTAVVKEVVAHELAHVWQNNVSRGGVGPDEPWIHEGGAEAIALEGLRGSGLFSKIEADAYSTKLIQECETLRGSVESYRGIYACGFKRFSDLQTPILPFWKSMMDVSESTGAVYSSAMIEKLKDRSTVAR